MLTFTKEPDPFPIGVAPANGDYALTFWTPVIGPTSILMMRTVAICLAGREAWGVDIADFASLFGVRGIGRSSPLRRTLKRLEQFRFLTALDGGNEPEKFRARITVPEVPVHHVDRFPSALKLAHGRWREARLASNGSNQADGGPVLGCFYCGTIRAQRRAELVHEGTAKIVACVAVTQCERRCGGAQFRFLRREPIPLRTADEGLGAYCDDHGFEADDERCESNI